MNWASETWYPLLGVLLLGYNLDRMGSRNPGICQRFPTDFQDLGDFCDGFPGFWFHL